MARKRKGNICRLLKNGKVVKCYNRKGELIGIYVPKKKRKK